MSDSVKAIIAIFFILLLKAGALVVADIIELNTATVWYIGFISGVIFANVT